MISARETHRIGEAARLVGVSPSALRLWERQGLVAPTRTGRRYRLYTSADVERLRRIRAMRTRDHLNAPGILRLLDGTAARERSAGGANAGARLRQLRLAQGLTLREAADRAGLSAGYVSAIERRAAHPSVASLQRLTTAYGTTMLDLLHRPQHAAGPVRVTERGVTQVGEAVRIEQLARDATMLEPQLFVLSAAAQSDGTYAHDGEEFLFVLDGAFTIWVGEDPPSTLEPGDALTFASTRPHRWRNAASGETRLLWINTPPTF
jgi:DNA-binding transcriptional MerR regulator